MKSKTDIYIGKFKEVHGDKYDYSLVEYVNYNTKIKIICKEHGVFEQSVGHHLSGCGCPFCSKNVRYNNITFSEKANFVHENKYDYSLIDYKNSHTSIKIICKKHGIFEQKPWNHLNGMGCSLCSKNKQSNNNKENFRIRKIRDQIKNDYCKKNNIRLFRIKYDDDVFEKLDNILKNDSSL